VIAPSALALIDVRAQALMLANADALLLEAAA
jgi:hypothetical protein